jgi:hypothetical protein
MPPSQIISQIDSAKTKIIVEAKVLESVETVEIAEFTQ